MIIEVVAGFGAGLVGAFAGSWAYRWGYRRELRELRTDFEKLSGEVFNLTQARYSSRAKEVREEQSAEMSAAMAELTAMMQEGGIDKTKLLGLVAKYPTATKALAKQFGIKLPF